MYANSMYTNAGYPGSILVPTAMVGALGIYGIAGFIAHPLMTIVIGGVGYLLFKLFGY